MTVPKGKVAELRPIKGYVPPHDMDAEAAVLSACLLDNHALDLCVGLMLSPEHFYSHANRVIYETMIELRSDGTPCDVVTLASKLRGERLSQIGGSPYLAQIIDSVPSVSNVETYAIIVRDKWRQRQAIAVMRAHAAEAYGNLDSVQEWIDAVEADIAELARHFDTSRGMRTIGRSAASALERITLAQKEGEGAMVGVPFGYARVDDRTKGMMGGELYVIAARPGMGKTSFALGVAMNIASPGVDRFGERVSPTGSVGFFSLEMSDEALALRAIAVEKRMDAQRLRSYEIASNEWQPFTDGVAWAQHVAIHVDPTPGLSVADMRSRARRLAADLERSSAPPLRLIVVDYLQIMGTQRNNQSREELVAESARGLKALAKELNVPVMALAQLNRDVERRSGKDKRPQLSDLRESGAIEQEADLVAFLYRDEYYFEDTQDKGVAEFIVRKQRSGPTGTVRLSFTAAHTRFDNLADDYDFDGLVDYEDGL